MRKRRGGTPSYLIEHSKKEQVLNRSRHHPVPEIRGKVPEAKELGGACRAQSRGRARQLYPPLGFASGFLPALVKRTGERRARALPAPAGRAGRCAGWGPRLSRRRSAGPCARAGVPPRKSPLPPRSAPRLPPPDRRHLLPGQRCLPRARSPAAPLSGRSAALCSTPPFFFFIPPSPAPPPPPTSAPGNSHLLSPPYKFAGSRYLPARNRNNIWPFASGYFAFVYVLKIHSCCV